MRATGGRVWRAGTSLVLTVGGLVAIGAFCAVGAPVATASPSAPSVQTAVSLLSNPGYAAALGAAVSGPEDDGGAAANDGSQRSVTRVQTDQGLRYTVTLDGFTDEATASAAYASDDSPGFSEPIDGVADEGIWTPNGTFVRRGAEVLAVIVDEVPGSAAEQQVIDAKESTGNATDVPEPARSHRDTARPGARGCDDG